MRLVQLKVAFQWLFYNYSETLLYSRDVQSITICLNDISWWSMKCIREIWLLFDPGNTDEFAVESSHNSRVLKAKERQSGLKQNKRKNRENTAKVTSVGSLLYFFFSRHIYDFLDLYISTDFSRSYVFEKRNTRTCKWYSRYPCCEPRGRCWRFAQSCCATTEGRQ